MQGEGGIYPAKKEFLEGLRKLCDERDLVLIFDEVQCGMGRTGTMFAYEQYGVKPDVVALAKGLGCGVPVGAFVASEKFDSVLVPGDHGTTYGGNPFATCAVSKVFDLFKELNILDHVKEVGAYLEEKLEELVKKYDFLVERRGLGLMQGVEFDQKVPVGDVVNQCLEKGVIFISAGNNTLRFLQPLVIEKAHVDEMVSILDSVLSEK